MDNVRNKIKTRVALLRIMPDLSLRLTFVLISLSLVIASFFLGDMHGRSESAAGQLAVTNTLEFVPWSDTVLHPEHGDNTASVGAIAQNFVASANGKLYYPANCKSAARIKEENRVWFATAEDAKREGLLPAKNCTGL